MGIFYFVMNVPRIDCRIIVTGALIVTGASRTSSFQLGARRPDSILGISLGSTWSDSHLGDHVNWMPKKLRHLLATSDSDKVTQARYCNQPYAVVSCLGRAPRVSLNIPMTPKASKEVPELAESNDCSRVPVEIAASP